MRNIGLLLEAERSAACQVFLLAYSRMVSLMGPSLLADLVLVVHAAFILFALFGGFFILVWRWIAVAHLLAVAWAAYIELTGGICPLTPLENSLRRAAGEAGYSASFIEHYLLPILYPPGLTPGVQIVLAGVLLVVNGLIYALVLSRLRARRDSCRSG